MQTNLEYALHYARLGYNIIPVLAGEKRPRCKHGASDATTDEAVITKWFNRHPNDNIGIVASNCFIIDLDVSEGKDGVKDWQDLCSICSGIDSNAPYSITGGGGLHLFFAQPSERKSAKVKIKINGRKTNIDVRSGNTYIVAPPSVHKSGKAYQWGNIELPHVHNLPKLPDRFFQILDESDRQLSSNVVSDCSIVSYDDRAEQCRKYLDSIPGIIESNERGNCHNRLLRVANIIFNDFAVDEHNGERLLREFNSRCVPLWSEQELRHKMRTAIDKPDLSSQRGSRLTVNPLKQVNLNDLMTSLQLGNKVVTENVDGIEKEDGLILLDCDPSKSRRIRWLWKDRIPCGKLVLVAGKGSAGKTTFVTKLASYVTNGGKWIDGSECKKGVVLYLYSEDDVFDTLTPRFMAAKADTSCVKFTQFVQTLLPQPDGKPSKIEIDRFCIQQINYLEKAVQSIESSCGIPVRMIIFDPLTGFLGGEDTNKNSIIREILTKIAEFGEKHNNISIIGIVHTKKGMNLGDSASDTISGAGEFSNVARAVYNVYVDKENDCRVALPSKWNLGKAPDGIQFNINPVPLNIEGEDVQIGAAEFIECSYSVTADDFLDQTRASKLGLSKEKRVSTKDWLLEQLECGAIPIGDSRSGTIKNSLFARAKECGYSRSALYRAIETVGCDRFTDEETGLRMISVPSNSANEFERFASGEFN